MSEPLTREQVARMCEDGRAIRHMSDTAQLKERDGIIEQLRQQLAEAHARNKELINDRDQIYAELGCAQQVVTERSVKIAELETDLLQARSVAWIEEDGKIKLLPREP